MTGLRNGRAGVRIPTGARDFYLLRIVGIAYGAHQASYLKDIGVLSRQGCEVISNLHVILSLRINYQDSGHLYSSSTKNYLTFYLFDSFTP